MGSYKCIDLFSGAGGLSSGFFQSGFKIEGAIEKIPIFSKPTI
ncbi:hypothetical protein N752_25090 [Desulforamulus aquiferis]|nr:hypothetical protein N752_25090 [Desulforamulus aquiferis]